MFLLIYAYEHILEIIVNKIKLILDNFLLKVSVINTMVSTKLELVQN